MTFLLGFFPYSLIKLFITALLRQSLSHWDCNLTLLEKIWSKKPSSWKKAHRREQEKPSSDLNSDTVFMTMGRLSRAWFFIHENLVRVFILCLRWENRHLAALGFGFFICNMQIIICISLCSVRRSWPCTLAEFSPTKSLDKSLVKTGGLLPWASYASVRRISLQVFNQCSLSAFLKR